MTTHTRECARCCEPNPPNNTTCRFCGIPLGPDPTQEADLTDPPRRH
ncbi:hypothetical protein [Streptomyces sp. bgisy154]